MANVAARKATVEAAVKADLALLAKRDPKIIKSGLAATLLELARQMDGEKNSATSKSMCAKALFEGLDRLRAAVPEKAASSPLDDIRAELYTALRAASASN